MPFNLDAVLWETEPADQRWWADERGRGKHVNEGYESSKKFLFGEKPILRLQQLAHFNLIFENSSS